MKVQAWRVHRHGSWNEVLELEQVEIGPPEPGQVQLRVLAAGINFADSLSIEGRYQVRAPLPFTPGIELVGEVLARADDEGPPLGSRVVASLPWGAFAGAANVRRAACLEVPESMPDVDAAAFVVTYQTAWFALRRRGRLRPGETLLVNNAAGGAGTAALQLGKALGARVMASAGGTAKARLCRELGAERVIDYDAEDLRQAVLEFTDGRGADVIYDPVGGEVFEASRRALAPEGRLVVVGFAGGTIPEVRANRIMLKNIEVTGLNWGAYRDGDSPLLAEAHDDLCRLYGQGLLPPLIGARYAFEDLPSALEDLRSRRSRGKLVLLGPGS